MFRKRAKRGGFLLEGEDTSGGSDQRGDTGASDHLGGRAVVGVVGRGRCGRGGVFAAAGVSRAAESIAAKEGAKSVGLKRQWKSRGLTHELMSLELELEEELSAAEEDSIEEDCG